ncbi:NAD(P)H-dependent glycerol-3-phosphate dehydrogenase [Snodgrassella alvi]|uniref:NAD(P)H-dependent glycerol-3-phosphate dehydrogenase n=1 Tax=Snodgrassella alvi TaxID=1196083 RepID=UPI002741F62F|nr:NAD(P)H-dependent glycerol-3-phosphate dehydrogenase [Snodgrassella alvi]WLT02176.1 NAD(P)H-dependent glycerol-3-phosphate dehydrogenase [Snodgrassella alvi]
MNIGVLGAGAWGTALAIHFSLHAHKVWLWTHNIRHVQQLQQERVNKRYLPDFVLPENLSAVDAFAPSDLIIIATPVSALRESARKLVEAGMGKVPVIAACKGFEQQTGLLPQQVLAEVMPGNNCIGVLSGPSFAQELAQQLPCAVTLASENFAWIQSLAATLNNTVLRLYANADVIGAAVGGAVKNVMAIATGIADGLHYGINARVALMTRGMAEISRLNHALGGQATTLMGLSGMGDLILTCTGSLSRNRRVGLLLAEGKSLPEALTELGHVAEGVYTVEEVCRQADSLGVDMPIANILKQLFHGRTEVQAMAEILMERAPKAE